MNNVQTYSLKCVVQSSKEEHIIHRIMVLLHLSISSKKSLVCRFQENEQNPRCCLEISKTYLRWKKDIFEAYIYKRITEAL